MAFTIDKKYQDELKGGLNQQGGVKLPFPAPTVYWNNGDIALKAMPEIKDARRFGGWGVDKAELEDLGLPPSPAWVLHTMTSRKNGASYEAYLFRSAWVAPIARRSRWVEVDGRPKSTVNYLCMLALRNKEGSFLPYGPIVLSAKSLTGKALDDRFAEFRNKTAAIRGEALANFFFHPIGTYGPEPVFADKKGKGGQSSSVTDPQLYIPAEGYTEAELTKYFVPNVNAELLDQMADYKRLAKEWIAEWDKKEDKQDFGPNPFTTTEEPEYV